jgi:hypothetical protein
MPLGDLMVAVVGSNPPSCTVYHILPHTHGSGLDFVVILFDILS